VYRLADFLTLGYPFIDSLYYVFFYRYNIDKKNVWKLISNTEYEKPAYLIIENTDIKRSKKTVKISPETIRNYLYK
jgi:hypothetical protein